MDNMLENGGIGFQLHVLFYYTLFVSLDGQAAVDLWLNETYELYEVLEYLKAPGAWHSSPVAVLNQTGWYENVNVTMHEVSTEYGRCYAIHFSDYIVTAESQFFTLKLNMSRHKELFLYIHEDYDEIGQNWGFYPILPTQVVIARQGHYTISAQNNVFQPFNNKGCRSNDDYSFPMCVVKWARKRFIEMFTESNRTGEYTKNI